MSHEQGREVSAARKRESIKAVVRQVSEEAYEYINELECALGIGERVKPMSERMEEIRRRWQDGALPAGYTLINAGWDIGRLLAALAQAEREVEELVQWRTQSLEQRDTIVELVDQLDAARAEGARLTEVEAVLRPGATNYNRERIRADKAEAEVERLKERLSEHKDEIASRDESIRYLRSEGARLQGRLEQLDITVQARRWIGVEPAEGPVVMMSEQQWQQAEAALAQAEREIAALKADEAMRVAELRQAREGCVHLRAGYNAARAEVERLTEALKQYEADDVRHLQHVEGLHADLARVRAAAHNVCLPRPTQPNDTVAVPLIDIERLRAALEGRDE